MAGYWIALALYLIGAAMIVSEYENDEFGEDIPGDEPRVRPMLFVVAIFWPIFALGSVLFRAATWRE